MNNRVRNLVFSSFAFLAASGLVACDDSLMSAKECDPACENGYVCENGSCKPQSSEAECKSDSFSNVCEGTKLKKCVNDKFIYEECAPGTCNVDKCENTNAPECDVATHTDTCEENSVKKCVDGRYKLEPCGTQKCEVNKCVEATIDECQDTDAPQCKSTEILLKCVDKKWTEEPCTGTLVCQGSACVDPNVCTPECDAATQDCVNGTCMTKVVETDIGKPCSCTGTSCEKSLNLDELSGIKSLLSDGTLIGGILPLNNLIKGFLIDGKFGTMMVPDYFSTGNKGCESVGTIEGATVGCFRDYTINMTPSIINIVKNLATFSSFLPALQSIDFATLANKLENDGLQLVAKNGYCMAAAINMSAETSETSGFPVHIQKLMTDFNQEFGTGDASKMTACPAGSELIKHVINEEATAQLPKLNVGFGICLKACRSDDDCRKSEGYSCLDMPNGDASFKKVCFDKKNIDNISAFLPTTTP